MPILPRTPDGAGTAGEKGPVKIQVWVWTTQLSDTMYRINKFSLYAHRNTSYHIHTEVRDWYTLIGIQRAVLQCSSPRAVVLKLFSRLLDSYECFGHFEHCSFV